MSIGISTTYNGAETAIVDAMSCDVQEVENESFELTMTYPADGANRDLITVGNFIQSKPNPYDNKQPFRIYRVDKNLDGTVTAHGEHISYLCASYICKRNTNYSEEGGNAANFAAYLNSEAAENYTKLGGIPFTISTTSESEGAWSVTSPTPLRTLMLDALNTYEGDWKFDGTSCVFGERGSGSSYSITYGQNATALSDTVDSTTRYTHIFPYWNGDVTYHYEQSDDYTQNEYVYYDNLYVPIGNEVTDGHFRAYTLDLSNYFAEKPTSAQILAKTQQFIQRNLYVLSTDDENISLDIIQRGKTLEYYGQNLDNVQIGDTVNVTFPFLGISSSLKCTSMRYDALLDMITNIGVGVPHGKIVDPEIEPAGVRKQEHTITYQVVSGEGEGDVSKTSAYQGDTVTFTANPDKGYYYSSATLVWYDGEEMHYEILTPQDDMVFTMVNYPLRIDIAYTLLTYDVTTESKVTADGETWTTGGGTITTDLQHCHMGDQVEIFVTETPEYELQSIEAVEDPDIIPSDPLPKVQINHDTGYWLTMPAENVKITGYFVGKAYNVTVSSSEQGNPAVDKTEARYGQKVTITPNPKAGYTLNSITVVTSQGSPVQVTPQHEFYMPADDVVVTVTYTAGTYSITLSQQTGGTISAPQTATVDSVVTVTVSAQTNYELDHLTITKSGGGNVSATEDNKFIMPAANVTITPTFKLSHEIDHVVRFSTDDASVGDVRIYRKDHTMLIFQGDISTDDTTHTKRIDNVVITESTWS